MCTGTVRVLCAGTNHLYTTSRDQELGQAAPEKPWGAHSHQWNLAWLSSDRQIINPDKKCEDFRKMLNVMVSEHFSYSLISSFSKKTIRAVNNVFMFSVHWQTDTCSDCLAADLQTCRAPPPPHSHHQTLHSLSLPKQLNSRDEISVRGARNNERNFLWYLWGSVSFFYRINIKIMI